MGHVNSIAAQVSNVIIAQQVINSQHHLIAESKRMIEKASRDIQDAKEIMDREREAMLNQWKNLSPKLTLLKLRSRLLSVLDSQNNRESNGMHYRLVHDFLIAVNVVH